MEEWLKSLNIYLSGDVKNGEFVADIMDSDEYDKIIYKLDKADGLELDEDSSTLTIHNATNIYESDKYIVVLNGDFDNDLYKLTVKEQKWKI